MPPKREAKVVFTFENAFARIRLQDVLRVSCELDPILNVRRSIEAGHPPKTLANGKCSGDQSRCGIDLALL